jgi:hypothetical protein
MTYSNCDCRIRRSTPEHAETHPPQAPREPIQPPVRKAAPRRPTRKPGLAATLSLLLATSLSRAAEATNTMPAGVSSTPAPHHLSGVTLAVLIVSGVASIIALIAANRAPVGCQ